MNFQLSERIPKDNFYRRLRETLDLQSIYSDTQDLYGRTGKPSIDPVVFFKLMLTGYLENITSDRRLVEHCLDLPCKRIQTTAYDEPYRRAHDRQQSKQGHRMKKLRQSTVEPVFDSLVYHYGLKKINVVGKAGAHKVILMAATCFNLKKYLKSIKRKTLKREALEALKSLISTYIGYSPILPAFSKPF